MNNQTIEIIESNDRIDPLDVWLEYRLMTRDIIFDRESFHKNYQLIKALPIYFKYAKKTVNNGKK
jgi:hypothetical protein